MIVEPAPLPSAEKDAELPRFRSSSSASFFAERFSAAFPGVRGIEWFSRSEAAERLAILLASPLGFSSSHNSILHPIWWLRDGNSHIESFEVLEKEFVLLDEKELLLNRIAAVYSADYKRLFVYVECSAMQPTGVYDWPPERIKSYVEEFGYAWEEYGLYKATHRVTRQEYDDRATKILGKIVQMDADLVLRVRYITPYNFIVTSHDSPINEGAFDQELEGLLNGIMSDPGELNTLVNRVKALPSRVSAR